MKIFCIGFNKTGTRSLMHFFKQNGFSTAPVRPFELMMTSYYSKNYEKINKLIKSDYSKFSFFKDVPFSCPDFYKSLDSEFNNSKFILTIRDDEDEWYDSLIRFHSKFGDVKNVKNFNYVERGWMINFLNNCYGSSEDNPYDEKVLKNTYLKHNRDVKEFFKGRDNDLLIINLKDKDTSSKIEKFLGVELSNKNVPHVNKTK